MLSRKQPQAIAALLAQPTVPKAAKVCGVAASTLARWLQEPEFQRAYRAAQRAVVDDAIRDIQAATVEAVATLRRNLKCKNVFAENAAAQAILSHALKAVELRELAARIDELEQLLQAPPRDKRRRA
jgi:hypothetical protein